MSRLSHWRLTKYSTTFDTVRASLKLHLRHFFPFAFVRNVFSRSSDPRRRVIFLSWAHHRRSERRSPSQVPNAEGNKTISQWNWSRPNRYFLSHKSEESHRSFRWNFSVSSVLFEKPTTAPPSSARQVQRSLCHLFMIPRLSFSSTTTFSKCSLPLSTE